MIVMGEEILPSTSFFFSVFVIEAIFLTAATAFAIPVVI